MSEYIRQLCLRRGRAPAPVVVAGTRRNPEARELMQHLSAIGNNLNQLARQANTNGAVPEEHRLREALELVKTAMGRVLAL